MKPFLDVVISIHAVVDVESHLGVVDLGGDGGTTMGRLLPASSGIPLKEAGGRGGGGGGGKMRKVLLQMTEMTISRQSRQQSTLAFSFFGDCTCQGSQRGTPRNRPSHEWRGPNQSFPGVSARKKPHEVGATFINIYVEPVLERQ